jgi:hypothetical protein
VTVPAQPPADTPNDPAPTDHTSDGTEPGETPTAAETESTAEEPDEVDDAADENLNNREARYRVRAKKAETERDAANDLLKRTRQAVLDHAAAEAGLDPRLLAAAGHTIDSLVGQDGLIDPAAVAAAVEGTRIQWGISRRPAPVPNLNVDGMAIGQSGSEKFTNAFGPRR